MRVRLLLASALCVLASLVPSAVEVAAQVSPGAKADKGDQVQVVAKRLRESRHQGRLREVLVQIDSLPESVRKDGRVVGEWIQAFLDMGKVDEAFGVAATLPADLEELAPSLAVALVRLKEARGNRVAARQAADSLVDKIPNNVDLRALLARLDIDAGDYEKAESALPGFADSIAPQVVTDIECSLALAKAAELMSDDLLLGRAVPLLESTLAKAPKRADVRALLARALVRWQRFEQAAAIVEAGLAQDDLSDADRAELLYARGFLARGQQDGEAAVKAFDEVLALVPDHPKGLLGLARCKLDEGDLDAARELLDRCLERDASDLDALLTLADVEGEAGHLEEAESALRSVLLAKPNHLKGLWQLSRLLARKGGGTEMDLLLSRYEARKKALDR